MPQSAVGEYLGAPVVRSVAVSYGERRTFFLLIHRTSQSEVLSPFPYKGRLIGDAVCFEAISYGGRRTFSGAHIGTPLQG